MKYLRTLTGKSSLGFGTYAEIPVQRIIDQTHTRYLRWVYYNCSFINFTDDVLKQIYVEGDNKISKPGTNKALGERLDDIMFASLANNPNDIYKGARLMSHIKKDMKMHYLRREKACKVFSSKKAMQSVNQGHTNNKY